jgi:hypothetical protein
MIAVLATSVLVALMSAIPAYALGGANHNERFR